MDGELIPALALDVLIVLAAGGAAGAFCKRWGVSLLVGYLLVGGLIGEAGLGLVGHENEELEYLAEAGALLLLFSVGISFSIDELVHLGRYLLVGGALQMTLVAVPLVLITRWFGFGWPAAGLAGAAGALSSTVLVFKALAEWGQTASPHGQRGLGILLFQDVALVPLMLVLPLITGRGPTPAVADFAALGLKSAGFVGATWLAHLAVARWFVPALARLRSVEIVVLFALVVLAGLASLAHALGLPAAIGALAAGLVLSGNRLSKQFDNILLPFRESFAAVFFVSLGMLLEPAVIWREPALLALGLVGMVALKGTAACLALRATGLAWGPSFGMGLGLAQVGEFSFLLASAGADQGLISAADFGRMLTVGLGTLLLTPPLLRRGIELAERWSPETRTRPLPLPEIDPQDRAVVVGIGPIGRRVAAQLETLGLEVTLVDQSPVNLHPFAQQGFETVSGDARDPDVLRRAHAGLTRIVVVAVPDDEVAQQVLTAVLELHPEARVLVRCRFENQVPLLRRLGAAAVVSEEAEASGRLLTLCREVLAN